MILYQIQECHDQLGIIYGDDLIDILLDIGKQKISRRLNGRTVCDSVDPGKRYDLTLTQRLLHTVSSCRLHADDLDVGI